MKPYDIEIAVPIETGMEVFIKRIPYFKKWGLLNVGKHQVNLVLLLSKDDDISLVNHGWPDGISVQFEVTPFRHVTQKLNYYYTNILEPEQARWFMRADDDSMNDISAMLNQLDFLYDHEREYYIIGPVYYHVQEIEFNIAKTMGFKRWYEKTPFWQHEDGPPHENEASLTSQGAMRRIKQGKGQKYLEMRCQFPEGAGDHAFCLAARCDKIHPISVRWFTNHGIFWKFSLFGGPITHIHHIAHDKTPHLIEWLNQLDMNPPPEIKNKFLEHGYFFIDPRRQVHEIEKAFVNFKSPGYFLTVPFDQEALVLGVWGISKKGQLMTWLRTEMDNMPDNLGSIYEEKNGIFQAENGITIRKL